MYAPDWDLPHHPGPEDSWQESDCYWWFDKALGIGGWHRIGQYENQALGQSSIFLYEIGGSRFLDRSVAVPGAECRRTATGQNVGRSAVECLAPQIMRYRYVSDRASVDLQFAESFYEPRDWMIGGRHEKALATETGHLEVGGRIRGKVQIGNREAEVDALAHRDRSWGPRNLHGLDVLWFCNGTAGPDLSWTVMDVRLSSGHKRTVGFIARGKQTEDINRVEVNVITAADAITPLRGFVTLASASGAIDLDIHTNQGFMQRIAPGPFIVIDQSSRVFVDGREGFADFGVVQNALHGEHLPETEAEVRLTCVVDGTSTFQSHAKAIAPGLRAIWDT